MRRWHKDAGGERVLKSWEGYAARGGRVQAKEFGVSYCLDPTRPVVVELRGIARSQLVRAERELSAAGSRRRQEPVRSARKRLKKVRGLLRLVRPSLRQTYRRENRILRDVTRELGVMTDRAAVLETVDSIGAKYRSVVPAPTIAAFRRSLEKDEEPTPTVAGHSEGFSSAVARLHGVRRRAARWRLRDDDFAAIAGGLERTFRDGRRAMRAAVMRPKAGQFHAWRRHAKAQWLQMRLLDARCARRLRTTTRALEMLDDVLGRYHDVDLVKRAVERDASLTRDQKATILRAVAVERRRLRRRAGVVAARIYDAKPKAFVRRVRRLWRRPAATSG
jgi:CHAD domain-containing protein